MIKKWSVEDGKKIKNACGRQEKSEGCGMLKVENLSKSYDKGEVLHEINLEVERGTVHGLVGENGSGKTTLIKCITGIYRPDQGIVTLAGEPVYENPLVKERIGYVADRNDYFPRYPLGRMVHFFRQVYKKFDVEKFKSMNQFFGLDMNMRVGELSKGQKMCLAFLLNMAANTDVLLLDEPTSGLDALGKRQLLEMLIKEVEERELTVLISSHHLGELEKICDKLTIIRKGSVSVQSQVDEIKKKIRKINLVFDRGLPEGFLQEKKLLRHSHVGNIYTGIFEDLSEKELSVLKEQYRPVYVEELPVNLEEVFVYTNGGD